MELLECMMLASCTLFGARSAKTTELFIMVALLIVGVAFYLFIHVYYIIKVVGVSLEPTPQVRVNARTYISYVGASPRKNTE